MSAIFIRPGDDEGIDMPVKEPVSKSMLCVMFGIDEDEFIFIFNENGNIEITLLGGDSTFTPKKTGTYLVKTAKEQDTNDTVQRQLCNVWEDMYSYRRNIFNGLSDKLISKIFNKMNYKAFGLFAQTCQRVQDAIEGQKMRITTPFVLQVKLEIDEAPIFYMHNEYSHQFPMAQWKKFIIDLETINVLKQFHLKAIQLDARNPDLTTEVVENFCSFLTDFEIHGEILVVRGVDPAQTALLAKKMDIRVVYFDGKLGNDVHPSWTQRSQDFYKRMQLQSFTPELFPNLQILEINSPYLLTNCHKSDLFIRMLQSHYIRFTHSVLKETALDIVKPLFEKYLTHSDHGTKKAVQIELTNIFICVPEEVMRNLLSGHDWQRCEINFDTKNDMSPFLAKVYHTVDGVTSSAMIYVARSWAISLTVIFASETDDFGRTIQPFYTLY